MQPKRRCWPPSPRKEKRHDCQPTADPVYNEMLLSFREADFRLAAYKAMVTGKEIGRAIVTAARSAAGVVSARNATVSAFIQRQEAAGLHRREEYARDSDLVVRDTTGSIDSRAFRRSVSHFGSGLQKRRLARRSTPTSPISPLA